MAVTVACQGIVELRGVRHRKWSRAATVTATCQGMMVLRGVCHRKWGRVVAVLMACQGARICRLKLGSGRSPISVEFRERSSWRLGSWVEPNFRGSPGGTLSKLKLRVEPDSCRSPGGVLCNQS